MIKQPKRFKGKILLGHRKLFLIQMKASIREPPEASNITTKNKITRKLNKEQNGYSRFGNEPFKIFESLSTDHVRG